MLNNQDREFYRKEEEFQWAPGDLKIYMNDSTYWQRMELTGFVLNFLTVIFAILLCLCHRKIIYTALIALDEIQQTYRAEAAHPETIPEQHIFTLPLLPSIVDELDSTANPITSLTAIVSPGILYVCGKSTDTTHP